MSDRRRVGIRRVLCARRRAALDGGRALLGRLEAEAHPEAVSLAADLAILANAHVLIQSASQRLRARPARRQAAVRDLFAVCVTIRRRIKRQFPGPRHDTLHRLFGAGMDCAPGKPHLVRALADQILAAIPGQRAALRAAGVSWNSLVSLQHQRQALEAHATRPALQQARRETEQRLDQVATRVLRLVGAQVTTLPLDGATGATDGCAP